MKRKVAIVVGSLFLFLNGCGEDGELPGLPNIPTAPDSDFESGTYAVSNARLASTADQCGFLSVYQDPEKKIIANVSGTSLAFNLTGAQDADEKTFPSGSFYGDSFETETEYTAAFGDTCVTTINSKVTGTITDDNKATTTLVIDVTEASGNCAVVETAFAAVPCQSTYTFDIQKQDE